MQETAWAKLNLALHVRARRADGYHALETLFAFAEDGDVLTAEPADVISLDVTGPFAAALGGDDNLVLRAAHALKAATGTDLGARLHLDKKLPVAAGLGGGSADAAAALRLLARLWGELDESRIMAIAADLGADVPACLVGRTLRGEGKGDELRLLDGSELASTPVLLVNPGIPLATAPVFANWDGVDRGPLGEGAPLQAALAGRNDLEPAAIALVPQIAAQLVDLRVQPGVLLARMSGSGASSFALFASDAARSAAADVMRAAWPDGWCFETRLR